MEKHDLLVLNELTESGSNLRPSIQVEHALAEIKDSYQTPPLAKIPFTEIAALGGSFAGVVETMATPAAEGLYRCVFPKGITGTLATINHLSNKPVVMLYDKKVLCFHELKDAV